MIKQLINDTEIPIISLIANYLECIKKIEWIGE